MISTKPVEILPLRPGAHQSSKAAFCKSAFAKSKLIFGKSAFSRSRFAFRRSIFASPKAMVWPSATSKMLSDKTCQNLPKRAQKHFCFLLDWCAPGLSKTYKNRGKLSYVMCRLFCTTSKADV